jgi:glucose/arabinose dehydrogenase
LRLTGSWNRRAPSGYKVVYVPFDTTTNLPSVDHPLDFLVGFHSGDDEMNVYGRPAGVAVAADGALLVADDTGGVIWRISVA